MYIVCKTNKNWQIGNIQEYGIKLYFCEVECLLYRGRLLNVKKSLKIFKLNVLKKHLQQYMGFQSNFKANFLSFPKCY